MALDDDIIRIMIHTDSHLGFKERDPLRGDDSFAAFEEALKQAKLLNADMVIHAGDMFHENKPSRRTTHNAMRIFREHCLGEDPVYISCVNDQEEVFRSNHGRINYEDPFQCVSLPYFAIHGNHDDPSREGTGGEALAALDLLAVSNLINYYGKSERVEDIEIHPVLINKNGTKLALYGLGAIRDERLSRMWRNKKVRFIRPRDIEGETAWFNILVLHQNRDYGRGTKNCIHESMIPDWINVVIWGNEHECQPELAETLVGTFRIYQPGSSIATSLVKSESADFPKKFGMLEIKGIKYRLKTRNFTQLRPFIFREIKLQDLPHLDPQDPSIEDKIRTVLQEKIETMIAEGRENARLVEEGAQALKLTYRVKDPQLVLLRLRVEYEGFVSLNQQRFGAAFVGQVANPSELLLFAKKSRYGAGNRGTNAGGAGNARRLPTMLYGGDAEGGEDTGKVSLDELVFESLSHNSSLSILPSTEMELAINSFVIKKNVNAISDAVAHALEIAQDSIWKDKGAPATKDAISTAAALIKSSVEGKAAIGKASKAKATTAAELLANLPVGDSDEDTAAEAPKATKRGRAGAANKASPAKAATKKPAARAKRPASPDEVESVADSVSDIADDSEEDTSRRSNSTKSAKSATARPARAQAKKTYVQDVDSGEDLQIDDSMDEEPQDEIESEEEEEEKPKRGGKKPPAAKKSTAAKKPAAAKKPPAKRGAAKKQTEEVMDLVSDDDDDLPRPPASKTVASKSVSQVLLTASYTPSSTAGLNENGVGTGMSISASGTQRRRELPAALQSKAAASKDWD
jgi:double-strand break repair protein MRE11